MADKSPSVESVHERRKYFSVYSFGGWEYCIYFCKNEGKMFQTLYDVFLE